MGYRGYKALKEQRAMPVSQKGESTLVFDTATKAVVEMSKRLPGKKRWKNGNLFVDATGNNLQEEIGRAHV